MGSSPQPEPGRPRKDLSDEIVNVLDETDHRAMTLGMITEEVDGARATVKDRIDSLLSDNAIQSDRIGNATAYWVEERNNDIESLPQRLDVVSAAVSLICMSIIGYFVNTQPMVGAWLIGGVGLYFITASLRVRFLPEWDYVVDIGNLFQDNATEPMN